MTEPRRFSTRSVSPVIKSIRPMAAFLIDAARQLGVPAADEPLFEVALVELLTNAVEHGAPGAPPAGEILGEVEVHDGVFTVRVFDTGTGFDLSNVERAQPNRDTGNLPEGGYGLTIVHAVFSKVQPIKRDGLFGIECSLIVAGTQTSDS